MKCSVSIITFQQKGYIRQAVESALTQQTSFPFEVIVGDDASTDGTREVLEELQAANPDRLRLLLPERNYGDYGLSNCMATIDAAQGEYIAFMDGDDYWTAPHKLQRQVDFMDKHPECAISAHRVEHVNDKGRQGLSVRPAALDGLYDYDRLLNVNFTPKSATIVRRSALTNLPDWYRTTRVANAAWLLNLLVADGGRVGFLDEVMAAHRIHESSVTVHYGIKRLLTDKLAVLEMLRPGLPEHELAFIDAERRVRWKLKTIGYSPQVYSLLRKTYDFVFSRRK
jgi:glycosyltransferase involved in cell wall biosynthesis